MATSTSLNLRAVLKTAVTRSGMDAPARVVVRADAVGQGAVRRRRRAGAAARRRPVRRAERRRPRAGGRRRRVLPGGARRAVAAAADRAVLPFPSHEVDPYRGLAPHFGVDVGARAGAARARHRHARVVVASAAALLPRVSVAGRLLAASLELKPGQDIAPTDLAELLVDAGFTREDPADEHGEFAVRGGILDIFPAGEAQPGAARVHRRHDRDAAHVRPATQRSIAPIDQTRRSCRCATCSTTISGARRSSTICRARRTRGSSSRSATKSRRTPRSSLEQVQHSYEEALSKAGQSDAAGAAGRTVPVEWDACRARGSPRQRGSRSSASTTMPSDEHGSPARPGSAARPQHPLSAGGRAARPRRRLGRRDPPAARRRRDDAVRGRDAGPRRADDRAAEGIRHLRRSGRARRGRAVRGGARRGRQPVARLPAARRRPADLRRSRRLRGGAARARAPAVGDEGVPLRPARSEGRRSRRPRRSRHRHVRRPEADRRRRQRCRSSSSCATPARTSCSSRSSGSISFRSTPARRGRRSIGSAARRGSARRPGSRRRCATWPRSC